MESVHVFAPASVANVGCGYDTMGFSLEGIGEEVIVSKRADELLVITEIVGADLPKDPKQNVATIAIQSYLEALHSHQGFDVKIIKHFRPGSGLGASASSAAGAVFAANELLGRPLSKGALLPHALEGEAFASKCYHADNVAPALLGGFQVIRSYDPLELFEVPVNIDLNILVIFPDVQVKTAESKQLLPKEIAVPTARNQWANTAGLIHALHTGDPFLLKRSIEDHIAEPVRKNLIPHYDAIKNIVNEAGAVGFNISGSGPSMFALFESASQCEEAERAIQTLYHSHNIDFKPFHSKIDTQGCRVIS